MLVLSSAWLLAGCGTSEPVSVQYQEGSNITTYQSRTINTGHTLASSNYGSSRTLELRAVASCEGSDCKPERVQIAFLVSSGSNPVQFPDRSLKIETDTKEHELGQEMRRDAEETGRVGRHLFTVEMDYDEFEDFAHSDNVKVTVGSHSFEMNHARRSAFRALTDAAEGRVAVN